MYNLRLLAWALLVLIFTSTFAANNDSNRPPRSPLVAGTGWVPYDYFSREFVDPGLVVHVSRRPTSPVVVIREKEGRYPVSPIRVIDRDGYVHVTKVQGPVAVPIRSLCPQNRWDSKRRYAYSEQYGGCYQIGTKGPCKANMRFYLESSGSEYGSCDCDSNVGYSCGRPLVYWKKEDWCYPVYSRGPCRRNEWLVLDGSGRPICESNPCVLVQNYDDVRETDCQHWVYMRGTCVETHTRGVCRRDEVLLWDVYDSRAVEPQCTGRGSASVHYVDYAHKRLDSSRYDPDLPCLPGQRQTVSRNCRANYPTGPY